jgi:hypothetical protein
LATLAVQKITTAGIIPTYYAAASGGDLVANPGGETFLYLKNTGGSAAVITATATTPCDFNVYHSLSYSVSASTGEAIIALSKRLNTGANVSLTYTGAVSGLTLAVLNYPGTL